MFVGGCVFVGGCIFSCVFVFVIMLIFIFIVMFVFSFVIMCGFAFVFIFMCINMLIGELEGSWIQVTGDSCFVMRMGV
jgi:hypothetical protein